MRYLENNPIKNEIKYEIIDKLEKDYKGWNEKLHIEKLCSDLFDFEVKSGGFYLNNRTAKIFIDEYFEYLKEIFESLTTKCGNEIANKILLNIFDNPDKLVLEVALEVEYYILSECKTIKELWNKGKITLTDEIIDKIISEVEKV